MNNSETMATTEGLERLLSLSKDDLEKIFSQLSMSEIGDLLDKLKGMETND